MRYHRIKVYPKKEDPEPICTVKLPSMLLPTIGFILFMVLTIYLTFFL